MVLCDVFCLEIFVGYIYVLVMNNYYIGVLVSGGGVCNDNVISDVCYEVYCSVIVVQIWVLLVGVGNVLVQGV